MREKFRYFIQLFMIKLIQLLPMIITNNSKFNYRRSKAICHFRYQ